MVSPATGSIILVTPEAEADITDEADSTVPKLDEGGDGGLSWYLVVLGFTYVAEDATVPSLVEVVDPSVVEVVDGSGAATGEELEEIDSSFIGVVVSETTTSSDEPVLVLTGALVILV